MLGVEGMDEEVSGMVSAEEEKASGLQVWLGYCKMGTLCEHDKGMLAEQGTSC